MNDLPADGAAWRKLILDRMWEFLKPRGFKKDGTTFRRKTSEGYLVVNLQSSQWNTKFDLMVMVNLGVYYEALPLSQPLSKSGPKEYDCLWRARLRGRDLRSKQWTAKAPWQASEVAQDIVSCLAERGLPVLEDLETVEKLTAAIIASGTTLVHGGWTLGASRLPGVDAIVEKENARREQRTFEDAVEEFRQVMDSVEASKKEPPPWQF